MRYKTSWESWKPVGEDAGTAEASRESTGTLGRLLRYTGVKGLTLLVTVAVGLYLTILIVNLGGYVDEMFKAQILEAVGGMTRSGWPEGVEEPERTQIIEQTIWEIEEARGLHEPFLTRSARWLVQALTLNLGHGYSKQWFRDIGAGIVRDVIRERLPYTLVLVGISNIVLFISTVWASLFLSRKHGGLFDRLNVLLLSLTSAPSWIHGVVLIVVFAGFLRILPFPRTWDELPEEFTWELAVVLLRHMVLPTAAILIAGFFQSVYAWRAFFMIFRHEDYVEIARAKGLRSGAIEWSYIVRPTLPYVLTSFATMMILFWQGSIALEMVFRWPGIGPLFMSAARTFNTPLLLGIVVIFAYLLALTVFILEIAYALADPRVRVGSSGNNSHWQNTRVRRWPNLQPRQWLAYLRDWLRGVGSSSHLSLAAWRRPPVDGGLGAIELLRIPTGTSRDLSMDDTSAWEGPGRSGTAMAPPPWTRAIALRHSGRGRDPCDDRSVDLCSDRPAPGRGGGAVAGRERNRHPDPLVP